MSNYNRRNFNLSYQPYPRLFPHPENPVFDTPPPTTTTTTSSTHQHQTAPAPPPPTYTRHSRPTEIALSRTLSRTLTTSSSLTPTTSRPRPLKASSTLHEATYLSHPAFFASPREWAGRWVRMVKRREGEVVDLKWPVGFRRACVQAGVSEEREARGKRVWETRIGVVNDMLPAALRRTRVTLCVLEAANLLELMLLLAGAGTIHTSSPGTSLIQAAAIALVVFLLLNAAGINLVRTDRWRLNLKLKTLARDWSPVPVASFEGESGGSGGGALVLGMRGGGTEIEASRGVGTAGDEERMGEGAYEQGDLLFRWSLTGKRGSWWTSYRPKIKVELIIPPQPVTAPAPSTPPLEPLDTPNQDYGVPPPVETNHEAPVSEISTGGGSEEERSETTGGPGILGGGECGEAVAPPPVYQRRGHERQDSDVRMDVLGSG